MAAFHWETDRPRVPRLNLGVFKTPRGSTMTYDSAAVRPVSSRTLSKAVSDKQVTMFSNSLYTAEEAASQSSDTIPSWQGSQAQQDSSQVPALPGGRPMATRAYSMPLARGMDVPSTSSPAQQTPFSAAPSRLPPRPSTPQGALRSARMSRASSGAMDSSNLTLSQQQRLQRLRSNPLDGPSAGLSPRSPMPAPPLTSRTPRPGLSRPAPCLADERVLRPRRNDAHDPAAVLDRQSSLPTMLDTSDMRSFLHRPGYRNDAIQCVVRREAGSSKGPTRYSIYLESQNKFLMGATQARSTFQAMGINRAAHYTLSLDPKGLEDVGPDYLGTVKSNYLGTEFTAYEEWVGGQDDGKRSETAAVLFQYNVMGTRGPRKMKAIVPALATNSSPMKLLTSSKAPSAILEWHRTRIQGKGTAQRMVCLVNSPPRWNERLNAYCLNFNGRVTCASVKNFQLVSETDLDRVVLQFGKISKDAFTMDYKYPLTAMQAFSICLTSLDNKLACE